MIHKKLNSKDSDDEEDTDDEEDRDDERDRDDVIPFTPMSLMSPIR